MCLKHALRKCQLVQDYTVINSARNKNRYHFSYLKGPLSSITEKGRDEFLKKNLIARKHSRCTDLRESDSLVYRNTFYKRQVVQSQRNWQSAKHQRKLTSGDNRMPNCVLTSHTAIENQEKRKKSLSLHFLANC